MEVRDSADGGKISRVEKPMPRMAAECERLHPAKVREWEGPSRETPSHPIFHLCSGRVFCVAQGELRVANEKIESNSRCDVPVWECTLGATNSGNYGDNGSGNNCGPTQCQEMDCTEFQTTFNLSGGTSAVTITGDLDDKDGQTLDFLLNGKLVDTTTVKSNDSTMITFTSDGVVSGQNTLEIEAMNCCPCDSTMMTSPLTVSNLVESAVTGTAVPEPPSLAVMGLASIGLLMWGRSRRIGRE